MRVKHAKMQYEIYENETDLQIEVLQPCDEFFGSVEMQQFPCWMELGLSEKYHLINLKHNRICLNPIFVLAQINHDQLKKVLRDIFSMFTVTQVFYCSKIYEQQMQLLVGDIDRVEEFIFHKIYKTKNVQEWQLRIYSLNTSNSREILDQKLKRLQKFVQEILIYPLDDYLSRNRLEVRSWKVFVDALVRSYQNKLKHKIQQKFKTMDIHNQIIIQSIESFNQGRNQEYTGFKAKVGIKFTVVCYQEAASKLYNIVQKWLEKLNWMILEVDQIECCKKQNLSQFLQKKYNKKMVLLSTYHSHDNSNYKLVIFEPKKSKQDLISELRSIKRIIGGLQFPDYDFSSIQQYSKFFYEFTSGPHQLKMSIYADYIITECSREQQQKLRKKIGQFLEEYAWQTVQIAQLADSYEIAIFSEFYKPLLQIKPLSIFRKQNQADKLYRKNWKKMSEVIDSQIKELYKRMRKQLVCKPLLKYCLFKQNYFKVSSAPEYRNLQYLESRRFKIQNKVTINVRSYASVSHQEKDCIFIIHDFAKCSQFQDIIKAEGITNFQDKINKIRILQIQLRFSPIFDKVTSWVYKVNQTRNKIDRRWLERLKTDFEEFIEAHHSHNHLKIMLAAGSEELIQSLLPALVEFTLDSCNLLPSAKLKELTFFTSVESGPEIRNAINLSLKRMSERGLRIERTSDLNLQLCDFQKILEYRYFKLSYLQNDEKTYNTTALNSFFFQHEKKKKGKTPIFLPTPKSFEESQLVQYIVCFQDQSVMVVKGKRILQKKYRLDEFKQLMVIARVTKKYFGMVSYVVVFGSEDGSLFCKRLFFTSWEEVHYKTLQEVELDLANQKILTRKNKMPYEIVKHEYVQLYKVETHKQKVQELTRIICDNQRN